jgi:hypothetical protein
VGYTIEFDGKTTLSTGVSDIQVKLTEDFDPTHVSEVTLPAGSDYRYRQWYTELITTPRNPLNGRLMYAKGGFFSGNVDVVEANLVYRYQPYLNLSVNTVYTDLRLPAPFEHHRFWLVGPKLDITFSPKVYLTTFVQYNEQLNNTNVNIRFQWRYKPVSDLFIVYTDNYFANTREVRNRALVLKLTYWWN